jgi:hypothetical protein
MGWNFGRENGRVFILLYDVFVNTTFEIVEGHLQGCSSESALGKLH